MRRQATAMIVVSLGLSACVEETPLTGPRLYADYCAACHGADAKGWPEVGGKVPPDLTTLSARHGGTFPAVYVMSTIDGYARDQTHGPMPAFGDLIDSPVETWVAPDGTATPTPLALILLAEYLEDRQGD